MKLADMVPSHRYEIRYRIEGLQRFDRIMVATYVGSQEQPPFPVKYIFSGRPVFGTTDFQNDANVHAVTEVPVSTKCVASKRAMPAAGLVNETGQPGQPTDTEVRYCRARYEDAHDEHMRTNGDCPWCGAYDRSKWLTAR